MADLQSPGVDIRIIEEEIGATTGPGTVPLIFIATATNKTTEAGTVAEGTLPENAGKLELITSQRELLQRYGIPSFRTVDGSVVQGDETNEYGLHAAYSYLGLANRAYVVRANLNTAQLLPSEQAPRGKVANGTYWFNASESDFGIFVANGNEISGLAWDKAEVLVTEASDINQVTGIPVDAFGSDGEFAIVPQFTDNALYQKYSGSWVLVGSSAWYAANPTTAVSTGIPDATGSTTDLIINGVTVSIISGTDAATVASSIIASTIPDITASVVGDTLVITNTAGGDITLDSSGDALTLYGFDTFYEGLKVVFDTHINVPTGDIAGSIWVKTTEPNGGAKFDITRYNAGFDQFQSQVAPLYANDSAATAALGSALSVGSLYVMYDGTEVKFAVKRWNGSMWSALSYVASNDEPTANPDEGTLWFNAALEADIMVNTGNQWRGYRNLYPATDSNGPMITSLMPTEQSTGAPLANYDLWIKSDERTGYPQIYRYLNGSWNLIDNTDRTTPFGIVFGDIRENSGPIGPWIKGGVAATGTVNLKAVGAFIANPGAGYTDGTYTTSVIGGTSTDVAELSVTVAAGQVIAVEVVEAGSYSALPTGGIRVKVTGITGTPTEEAEFNISWGVDSVVVTSGGAGYTTPPSMVIVGGGGVGASAFTTVDTGLVNGVTVLTSGAGYSSIPTVIINTPFGRPESDQISDMLVSDWCDPVALDVLNPQLFPAGTILFNTRRSSNNVKVWRSEFFDDITEYSVGNFLSDAYELANPGARDAAYQYIDQKPERWVTFSGNDLQGVGLFGRQAQRICVVRGLAEQIAGNQDIRSEFINYNLMAAPGYVELLDDLVTLNVDRRETAFIIADTPSDLSANATDIVAWATNSRNVSGNGRLGRVTLYDYAAMYYPWGLGTNVDGNQIVIPPSTIALRTYGFNDSVAFPWFPPAGTRRGIISNAESVGYLNEQNQYISVTMNQGQRDSLYTNKINPLTFIPGRGLLVYGDKTLSPNDGSALSRVNVARLVVYLRTILPNAVAPFLFELNTERTRAAAQGVVTGILVDLLGKDAISDFVVSMAGNTPDVIDRNELVIDVAIEPTKSIQFITIPIRLARTGSL